MSSRPHQVLFLLGAKLIGLDCVLPLAIQLKADDPKIRIHFLFLTENSRHIAEQNYILSAGMKAVGTVSVLSSGRGSLRSKAAAALRLSRWMAWLYKAPSFLFAYSDLGRFPLRLLAMACRSGGGVAVVHAKAIYPFTDPLRADYFKEIAGKTVTFSDSGDRLVLWHPDQRQDYLPWSQAPATILGTPRAYPAWKHYLQTALDQIGLHDDKGAVITLPVGQPILVGFYIGWVEIPSVRRTPPEQFTIFFEHVRAICPQAKILLKPHPLCDLEKMTATLIPFADLDISITFAHPQILAHIATVAVAANGSSVIDDVYAAGKALLDIGDYREGLEDGWFNNQGRIGASTAAAMAAALHKICDSPTSLPTPKVDHLIWPKPESLIETLCGPATHSGPITVEGRPV